MTLPRPTRPASADAKARQDGSSTRVERVDPKQLRPSDLFRFEPKPGMSSDELAELLSVFFEIDVHRDRFLKLSETLQRHFRLIKIA